MAGIAPRYTFDQIAEIAQDKERHHLELKNSTFVVIDHPLPKKRGENISKSTLISTTKTMLARECGAFANSNGGTLVIGFNDDGTLDSTPVPEVFEKSSTLIQQWIESLLKDCLEPPLENFDCYPVINDAGHRILVINVPLSEKAPHQSTIDRLYYTRQGTTSSPADHWLIEAIRNRRVHPKIDASLDLEATYIQGVSNDNTLTLYLVVSITNSSAVMAEKWALRADCPFVKETRVLPEADYIHLNLPTLRSTNTWMVKAVNPLFPTQSVKVIIRVIVPCNWQATGDKKLLSTFTWQGISQAGQKAGKVSEDGLDQEFYVNLSIFADSAPKAIFQFAIKNMDLYPKMVQFLKNEGLLAQ
jgi:hypothetical protein